MSKVDEVYDALAKGGGDVPADPKLVDALVDRVFDARRSEDVAERMAALRVTDALGSRAGLDVIETFMQDPAAEIRRFAFNLGIAARQDGLRIIREAAADPDPLIALEALRLLTIAADRSATTRARTLVDSDNPAISASAIRLLGHIAGPSVRRELELMSSDPSEAVRNAVHEALLRISGDLPRNEPGTWWDEPPLAPPPDPVLDADTPFPEESLVPPGSLSSEDTLDPDSFGAAKSPTDSTWGPEVDREEPLWEPMLPEGVALPPRIEPGPPWMPGEVTPLPETLPSDAYGLLRLLGMVDPSDHEDVIEALRYADGSALLENVHAHRVGRDPARGRGIAFAAMALHKTAWLGKVRRLLTDPEPLVRSAAAEAVASLGGPSTLTQISGLLQDENAQVRAAAVRALGNACDRWDMLSILPQWLEQAVDDKDPDVRAARDEVLRAMARSSATEDDDADGSED
ncbi:MAG: HEAT repeat domain-containing protein [Deltaproteobacteria bacterium]|nr:HEAT repeat domain-containing protein [Deltaproteobacteria bacterium]